jgi:hypothetical protein
MRAQSLAAAAAAAVSGAMAGHMPGGIVPLNGGTDMYVNRLCSIFIIV